MRSIQWMDGQVDPRAARSNGRDPRASARLAAPVRRHARTRRAGIAALALACAALVGSTGCGIESRKDRLARETSAVETQQETLRDAVADFVWPQSDASRDVVALQIEGMGTIRIALYPELAPKTVESFLELVGSGYYDGTTFHRVIPGFMIQGGDPNSKDEDPQNDGTGGPGFRLPDEFSAAPHDRGTVSMANRGRKGSSGSQFFIVHQPSPHLDGKYSVFGRVVSGMEVVDAITRVEIDAAGRWGPANRPIENVVLERVTIGKQPDVSAHAAR